MLASDCELVARSVTVTCPFHRSEVPSEIEVPSASLLPQPQGQFIDANPNNTAELELGDAQIVCS